MLIIFFNCLDSFLVANEEYHDRNSLFYELIKLLAHSYLDVSNDIEREAFVSDIRDSGFAYYNNVFLQNVVDIDSATKYALLESFNICPVHFAANIYCHLTYGNAFMISNRPTILNEDEIAFSIIKDHISPSANLITHSEYTPAMSPYSVFFQFLFFGFKKNPFRGPTLPLGDDSFGMDIKNFDCRKLYIPPTDKQLAHRLERLLHLPFQIEDKREKYEKYRKEKDKVDIVKIDIADHKDGNYYNRQTEDKIEEDKYLLILP